MLLIFTWIFADKILLTLVYLVKSAKSNKLEEKKTIFIIDRKNSEAYFDSVFFGWLAKPSLK